MFSLLIVALSLTSLAQGNIEGQICSDNSYYGEVEFVEDDLSCCSIGIGDPMCTTVNNVPMTFVSKKCETKDLEIPHTKTRQVPKNFTKQLCNTVWKTNSDGEKVWAGEDGCEEVVWLGFEEEEYEAVLRTTETECIDDTEIPYMTCQQTEFTSDQMCLECKPVAKPSCETVKTEKCGKIDVMDCKPQVTEPNCNASGNPVPTQEYNHVEKCLFNNDGVLSGGQPAERHHHT